MCWGTYQIVPNNLIKVLMLKHYFEPKGWSKRRCDDGEKRSSMFIKDDTDGVVSTTSTTTQGPSLESQFGGGGYYSGSARLVSS